MKYDDIFNNATNVSVIDEMYASYLHNPDSISEGWRKFFQELPVDKASYKLLSLHPSWGQKAVDALGTRNKVTPVFDGKTALAPAEQKTQSHPDVEFRASILVESYWKFAHLSAKLDPLDLASIPEHDDRLSLQSYGITSEHLKERVFDSHTSSYITLGDLVQKLDLMYRGTVGAEWSHIPSEEQHWLAQAYHDVVMTSLTSEQKLHILQLTTKAEVFEQFLHTKFVGAKRFSLEGGEGYLVALDALIDSAAQIGAQDAILGMAHRGRLNTLVHTCDKPYGAIFQGFMNPANQQEYGSGDVKYHHGYSCDKTTASGHQVHISLASNPSHLEAVNSVVIGKTRAKQDLVQNARPRPHSMAVLVHGDSSIVGQGSVAEVFNMSKLAGYSVCGTVHFVINNQIGFTTPCTESRSSKYCTDIAKSLEIPVFHVNGDDVEACYRLGMLAAKYRNHFKKDIIIDIVCYRKYGHNESDEPMYTQPLMYKTIQKKQSPSRIYSDSLAAKGEFTKDAYNELVAKFKADMQQAYDAVKTSNYQKADWLAGEWQGYSADIKELDRANTAIAAENLLEIGYSLCQHPAGFDLNPKLKRQLEKRKTSLDTGKEFDWSLGELLAYGSLVQEGYAVRFSGQDVERGTFSHRHCVVTDNSTGEKYNLLSNIPNRKGICEICNSCLSEFAVLGFEYGYSTAHPRALTIWEAQFGDFANGGVVIFDQFIAAAESKWLRLSGLVMLLPHGFEGQGPEHSSARLERYLQACAEHNIVVANCTTPANVFHILRRQIHSKTRKPLILMTPKSLLRHKDAVSDVSAFTNKSGFQAIIEESDKVKSNAVEKLIITSGKIYYELHEKRQALGMKNVAIVRVEQYYPFPQEALAAVLRKYKKLKTILWVQEEPQNMGAWNFIRDYLHAAIELADLELEVYDKSQIERNNNVIAQATAGSALVYVGRQAAASPATGYHSEHAMEQNAILELSMAV